MQPFLFSTDKSESLGLPATRQIILRRVTTWKITDRPLEMATLAYGSYTRLHHPLFLSNFGVSDAAGHVTCKCWEYPLWDDPLKFILWVSICYHRLYSINNNHSTGSSPDRQERRMSKGNRTMQVRPTWCAWWTVGVHRLPNNKHSKLTVIFDDFWFVKQKLTPACCTSIKDHEVWCPFCHLNDSPYVDSRATNSPGRSAAW